MAVTAHLSRGRRRDHVGRGADPCRGAGPPRARPAARLARRDVAHQLPAAVARRDDRTTSACRSCRRILRRGRSRPRPGCRSSRRWRSTRPPDRDGGVRLGRFHGRAAARARSSRRSLGRNHRRPTSDGTLGLGGRRSRGRRRRPDQHDPRSGRARGHAGARATPGHDPAARRPGPSRRPVATDASDRGAVASARHGSSGPPSWPSRCSSEPSARTCCCRRPGSSSRRGRSRSPRST